MAAGPSYLDKKNPGASRAGLSQVAAAPPSPHTPQRNNPSSTFSSPGGGLRSEEDYAVFEIGARHVSAGYAGDSRPKCTLNFDEEESRRVGDYRRWLPGYERATNVRKGVAEWSSAFELWKLDLREMDVGLIEDKFERAVREAYTRHLLQDSKSRKLVLVVPSVLPHPILGVMFSTLFRNFQIPAITLLPSALLTIIAAGQRSGIVVDIGWHETVVTTIYELREVNVERTVRAMRAVTFSMAELIDQVSTGAGTIELSTGEVSGDIKYDFERAEEATSRLAWCWPTSIKAAASKEAAEIDRRLQSLSISADQPEDGSMLQKPDLESMVTLPTVSASEKPCKARFGDLALPVEHALFGSPDLYRAHDDNEQVVPFLVYKVLATLSADLRSTCMSNIVITGGGSKIPGVKTRIMDEIDRFITTRGWNLVWGRAPDQRRAKIRETDLNRVNGQAAPVQKVLKEVDSDGEEKTSVPAGLAEQEPDNIQEKLDQAAAKDAVNAMSGTLRSVETLGAWEGASMIASLRLKGIVEVDRDVYLQHGIAGAKKEADLHAAKSRQSMGPGLGRSNVVESSAWTLGLWG